MSVINYTRAFNALDIYVKQHNSNTEELSCRIRQATASTARDIVKIYALSLLKANNIERINPEKLPPLKTNNVQLAKMANASTRTVQRHIKRLQDANVIIQKTWHGTNSGYDLWVNPKILLVSGQEPVENLQNRPKREKLEPVEKQLFKKELSPTCPHTDSSNNGYINNLIIGVDKLKSVKGEMTSLPLGNHSRSRNATGNTLTGYTERISAKKNDGAEGIVREKRDTDQTGGENLPPMDVARSASLNVLVNALWTLAQNTIYQNTLLSGKQEEIGKKLLYQWYVPVPDKQLEKVHRVYVERIGLVKKFLDKDPENRYVQLPYKYFDPQNPSGFAGTKAWWNKHKKRREEIRLKLILQAQVRKFLSNEKKDTAKQKPRLKVFRECETRIGKLNRPELLKEFHASILQPSTQGFIYLNT